MVRLRKQSCVGVIISAKTNFQNGSKFLEKAPKLFEATDKDLSEAAERNRPPVSVSLGNLTVALDIQKKAVSWLK